MEKSKLPRLRYVTCSLPGYRRQKEGKGFSYLDQEGNRIADKTALERIRKLVIPPAWQKVWICPFPEGHLQATGYDVRGRKQYLYHAAWRKMREANKFARLAEFGKCLPAIRKQMEKDIRRKRLEREKVTATALAVMEETLMRVGNAAYQSEYGSYGLTTLRGRHMKINGNAILFRFKGKKGVLQEIAFRDRRLARLLQKIKDLPGQEIFQYYDEEGTVRDLHSEDINDYIARSSGGDFTSKDYRTWAGTVHALKAIAACPDFTTAEEGEKNLLAVIDEVAGRLGNTRAVCRSYYIYPPLMEAYRKKELGPVLDALQEELLREEGGRTVTLNKRAPDKRGSGKGPRVAKRRRVTEKEEFLEREELALLEFLLDR